MSKATQVKSALVYLYGVILELQTQLAAALAQPSAASQAEIDAANAKIAELQKKYDDLVAQEAAEEAAEKADESVLDSVLGDFKKAYPDAVLDAPAPEPTPAPVPTPEPTPVDSVAPASAVESKYVG
jgi:hypothetical protein